MSLGSPSAWAGEAALEPGVPALVEEAAGALLSRAAPCPGCPGEDPCPTAPPAPRVTDAPIEGILARLRRAPLQGAAPLKVTGEERARPRGPEPPFCRSASVLPTREEGAGL